MASDDTLLEAARAADKALSKGEYWGWMHGMPHAVKDLADVRGFISSSGSPLFSGTVAKKDSLPVERMRNAGAIFIGKTNTPSLDLARRPTIRSLALRETLITRAFALEVAVVVPRLVLRRIYSP